MCFQINYDNGCIYVYNLRIFFKNLSGAIERCEHLVDFALRLDAWDEEPSPVLKEYNGLLRIRKLPALNTLACHVPESLDLAFRLRRKKFIIQVGSSPCLIIIFICCCFSKF